MSEFHRLQRYCLVMVLLVFSGFVKSVPAKNLSGMQEKNDENVYGLKLLTLSEQEEYLAMVRSVRPSNEQSVFLLEHRKTVRARALASGISWICLDVQPFAWVLSPEHLLTTAIQVASQECNQRSLRSQHGPRSMEGQTYRP